MIHLAVPASATQPGWGKLVALLIAVGAFWVGVQVHKRFKALREGTEINPFSSGDSQATETKQSQVSTPSRVTGTGPKKGARKWFRKG